MWIALEEKRKLNKIVYSNKIQAYFIQKFQKLKQIKRHQTFDIQLFNWFYLLFEYIRIYKNIWMNLTN